MWYIFSIDLRVATLDTLLLEDVGASTFDVDGFFDIMIEIMSCNVGIKLLEQMVI